ncbi:MAG: excinuclease ABC subunit UvrA [Rhodothermales bacterium]
MPRTSTRKKARPKQPAGVSTRDAIIVRGARQHNLKGVDLDIPRNKLVVFSGPSGSGKSSLAFDTIYAEGQRRYVESLSAYARQFLERMDKPDVDFISGLSPAIAIEQKTVSRNPRSNVATQTEIYDHLRLLFARIGKTISPVSGQIVTKDSPRSVAETLHRTLDDGTRFYLCFPFPDRKKISVQDELKVLLSRGFYRIVVLPTSAQRAKGADEEIIDLNETAPESVKVARNRLYVLVDRLATKRGSEETLSRVADSVEMAFREGGGRAIAIPRGEQPVEYSEFFERDGIRFIEPTPNLFSFNNPYGACPTCQGFGRVQGIDPDLVIPSPELSLRQGAVAPFRTDRWMKHFSALVKAASDNKIDIDRPYQALPEAHKKLVWQGAGDYIGIDGFVKYLERRSYKMHYRILLSRYRGYSTCPDCNGYRLRPEALYVHVGKLNIGELCELTTADALAYVDALELSEFDLSIAGRVLEEIRKRLRYLVEVGLDYLTLDRLSHTLSGGESQRINLSTSLGSSLVGSLYVLDEPSIGLHPRDTGRLIRILENLRDIGNTVVVVEHEEALMRTADYVVDIGPGSGVHGGEVVFQGPPEQLIVSEDSLTGKYLSGRAEIPVPERRRTIDPQFAISIQNAHEHNLKRLDVSFPLGAFVVVTGVSGSGKSTLVHDTLYRGLARLRGTGDNSERVGAHSALRGAPFVDEIEMVDQTPIGRTPRSNPVTYLKAFNIVRDLLANTHNAKLQGLRPGFFSFNVPGGRCEVCQGEGYVTIEMQFLADLYLECEACKGKRYKQEALDIRYRGKNVHDILQMTVDEAVTFFDDVPALVNKLSVLKDIGLGYITLGQPSNTLSGGEAQRVKLAAHLGKQTKDHTLYIFDEPTTGLHFDDIRKLLTAFDRLVDAGNSVIVVEHNLDVIKSADWLIDLGPEGGRRGGFVVAEGTPEDVAGIKESHTGEFLRNILG